MKVLNVLENTEIIFGDIEVNFGKTKQNAPTLCVQYEGKFIPLNTPDMGLILMREENSIG